MTKRAPSKHSRAARRATSPGIDLDKSLKTAKPPPSSVELRPSVLGIHQSAGVTKKTKKQGRKSVLSAKARRRQERGMDRAEAILDRTVQKVHRSKTQARAIDLRRQNWDDVNDKILAIANVVDKRQKTNRFALGDDNNDERDSGDEAVQRFFADDDEEMADASETPAAVAPEAAQPIVELAPLPELSMEAPTDAAAAFATNAAAVPLPIPAEDEDEIL